MFCLKVESCNTFEVSDEKNEREVESFRCALGNLLMALEFAFKALSSTMRSLSLVNNLSSFIGSLLRTSFDKGNDAFFKSYRPKVSRSI